MLRHACLAALPIAAALVGCGGMQSALAPQGPNADRLATLGWVLFVGGGLIFIAVVALGAYAVFARAERRRALGGRSLVVGGGIVFPVLVLSALLVYTFGLARAVAVDTADEGSPRIEVVGERWWWRVHYLDARGQPEIVTANEIRLPVGRPVEFTLKTADVIHSFWVPNLAGKLDMIPGRVNRLRLRADRPGVFRGQCAEYCGGPHALMAFQVVAASAPDFDAWMSAQRRPAAEPPNEFARRGRDLFLSSGCGACHTVRGTPALGTIGPDLTHVGGRLSIGAGIFPNHAGTLAGWIADSQHLKPENKMPSFNIFSGEELRAVAAYLESLK